MRHPSWKKPLLLSATLFALGTFAFWLEYSKKPADEEKEAGAKSLFALTDRPVSRIEIGKETKRFAFACLSGDQCKPGENAKWKIEAPIVTNADDANVNAFVQALDAMKATQLVDLAGDSPEKRADLLKQYQLDPESRARAETPRVTVAQGASVTTAYFGGRYPIGDGIFAGVERDGKFDDSRIFVLPSFHAQNLDQPLVHWRNKKILPLTQNDLVRVAISGGKKSARPFSIERDGSLWRLAQGADKLATDGDSVDAWTSAIAFLNAKGFAAEKKDSPEAKRILAGARSVLALELATKDGSWKLEFREKTFRDGKNRATQLYVTVSTLDPVYEIDTSTVDRLDRAPGDLRPAKLLTVSDRAEVRWVEFEKKGARPFTQKLVLENGEWKTGGKPVEKLRVERLLDRVSNRVIEEHLPPRPPAPESLIVRIGSAPGETKSELAFWSAGKTLYARDLASEDAETYRLAPDLRGLLPENDQFVFSRPPTKTGESESPEDHDGHVD